MNGLRGMELRPMTFQERVERLLDGLANRKLTLRCCRDEARALLRMLQEGQDSPHYVEPRPLWEPDIAFEGHDRPHGNIEPEEGALKTAR